MNNRLDFDLLPQHLIILVCENLMSANIQIQDMMYGGKTVTFYKIFMISKALPLAFWGLPK